MAPFPLCRSRLYICLTALGLMHWGSPAGWAIRCSAHRYRWNGFLSLYGVDQGGLRYGVLGGARHSWHVTRTVSASWTSPGYWVPADRYNGQSANAYPAILIASYCKQLPQGFRKGVRTDRMTP